MLVVHVSTSVRHVCDVLKIWCVHVHNAVIERWFETCPRCTPSKVIVACSWYMIDMTKSYMLETLDCMLILVQGQSVVSWQLPQAEVCVYHYILKDSRYITTANYNKYRLKNDSDWNWLCAPNFKCYHLILTIIAAVTAKFCQMLSFHRAKSLVYTSTGRLT